MGLGLAIHRTTEPVDFPFVRNLAGLVVEAGKLIDGRARNIVYRALDLAACHREASVALGRWLDMTAFVTMALAGAHAPIRRFFQYAVAKPSLSFDGDVAGVKCAHMVVEV